MFVVTFTPLSLKFNSRSGVSVKLSLDVVDQVRAVETKSVTYHSRKSSGVTDAIDNKVNQFKVLPIRLPHWFGSLGFLNGLSHRQLNYTDNTRSRRVWILSSNWFVWLKQDLTSVFCSSGESSAVPGSESQSSKMEVSLTLTNKFDIFNETDNKPDARGLLLSTKQLIIDVIRTQSGDSLSDILRASASHDQEVCHDWLMQRRARQDALTPAKMRRNESLVANSNLSLVEKKRKIVRSLRRLEGLGVLKPPQPENQILQMIAKDIRQQRLHRQRRGAELQKLRQTLSSLQAKSSFHSEQVDYYRHYITSCLENLTSNSKSTNKKAAESKGKKKRPALSYSATRLQEKGVLLEIEDLPTTQFKNVVFDIIPGPEKGSFNVKARFLGVEMEEFLLKYQDLLQLQYEGVAVMKMFDKAKVNVNLLIFLLNKKFFKK